MNNAATPAGGAPLPTIDEALDGSRLTPMHWRIWGLAAMGIFLDGFDFFIIAVALPLIALQFGAEAWQQGAISSAAVIGAVFGAGILGRYTDVIGRKKVFMIDLIGFIIFAVLSAVAWDIFALVAFRFFLGVAIGADYPIGASYVSELMPARLRGKMMVGAFSFQAAGQVFGAIVAIAVLLATQSTESWRLMLVVGIVPAIIVAILRRGVPESPRWLAQNGDHEDATRIVAELTGQQTRVDVAKKVADAGYRELFRPHLRRATILSSVPWFLMDIATYGIGIFTPTILLALGIGVSATSWLAKDLASAEGAAVIDILLILGFLVNIVIIDRVGRIRLQVIGFLGMAIGLVCVATATALPGGSADNLWLVFTGFVVFNFVMNLGPNSTTFLIPAEVFPTRVRATGHGFAAASGKLGAAVGTFFLPIASASFGLAPTLLGVAALALLGLVITALFQIEMTGKTLEEFKGRQLDLPG